MRHYRFSILSQSLPDFTTRNTGMTKSNPRHNRDASLNHDSGIAVVAAGRLGASLAVALTRAGRNLVAVSSRREEQRQWLRYQLARAENDGDDTPNQIKVCTDPSDAATEADIVFVTSSDAAIAQVARSCNLRPGQYAVHCSGLLGADILSDAAPGVAPGAMHPLQTFPSRECHNLIDGISFGIESPNDDLRGWLEDLAVTFNGSVVLVSGKQQRAAYHAAAVMSCGLLAGLTGVAAELWQQLGVPRDEALNHMSPMIRSTAESVAELGIPDALSGPFVRGDVDTVRAHLAATQQHSPEAGRGYAALALAQLHIAREKGDLKPGTAAEMQHIMTEYLENM